MIKRCFVTDGTAKKTGEELFPNGMVAEEYDRDGDGKPDMGVTSTYLGSQIDGDSIVLLHNAMPLFYHIDQDWNGTSDDVQIDVKGDGNCSGLVHYESGDPMHPNPMKQVME